MVNKKEFRAAMARFGDRQEDLADAIKLSSTSLSDKINSKVDFRANEIEKIAARYLLTGDEIRNIFFADIVAPQETKK